MQANNTPATSHINYNAYGYSTTLNHRPYAPGFNGAHFNVHTHCYHLGNGYRAYSPALARFTSPDFLSPFGRGGINTYAYCNGDPVNRIDPLGTAGIFARFQKWIAKRQLRKHRPVDRNAKEGAQKAGVAYEKAIIAHDQKIKKNVISELYSISDFAPHILDNVVKYLSPGDLESATNHLGRYHRLARRTRRISAQAYLEQHNNVLQGKISYPTDGRLNAEAKFDLEWFEESILEANRPYTLAGSEKYAFPSLQFELCLSRARELRRDLERHGDFMA